MKKLGICIPTYNRENLLKELLESIFSIVSSEDRDRIQICISDNASNDQTEIMVESFQNKGIEIIYYKNFENIGPDLNYLKCVEIATSEYCWLMGSDDKVEKDSISYILKELNADKEIDIFIGNRNEYDFNFNFIKKRYWLNENIDDYKFKFSNKEDTIFYLKNSYSIGAMYSYLSSIIVKKEKWKDVVYDENYTGTAYSHAYLLLKILLNNGSQKYLKKSIVGSRGGNDTFLVNIKQRFYLDYLGYLKLSSEILDEKIKDEFLKILTKEHPKSHLLSMSLNSELNLEEVEILKKVRYGKRDIVFIKSCIFFKKPLKIAYKIYKKIKK
ncbi:glycosyltransferase [Cetobacterium somerae]|uniref:glycosyltransferase family 2 protein n=1 Tax=Cetobacterium somerae TaxID=188913 RepID=UPI001F06FCF6|nr:glycosyltransferase family 2 protein [Cetobacterium somerae]UPO97414.1 glycosyltransferase [Cetobacterium somerae]